MRPQLERLLNVGMRTATLGARFLFVFFLAKYLDPASVGYYGLFSATVGYALYFVGLDFYAYVARELLKAPREQRGQMLKGQVALSGALYLIFFPVALAFLLQTKWPGQLLLWFFPLLLLEHFNQELSRLMMALSQQMSSSVILFVRQGSWAIVSVLLLMFYPPSRNLDTLLALWAAAGVSAAALGIWKLKLLNMGGWRSPPDWQWIKRGIGISGAFLLATLAVRGVNTFDRYWLEVLGGIDVVAAYVLLLGVAGTLMTFLDAGIFSYAYPTLIQYHLAGEKTRARAKIIQVLWQTLAFSGFFALVSWFLLPVLLRWIDNPIYIESMHLYPWLLLASVINSVSMVPHYGLYAQGQDKPIIYSHLTALLVFCVGTWLFSSHFGSVAVLFGLNLSFGTVLIWKGLAYWAVSKRSNDLIAAASAA
jgi:O-antigen/teichoic acid export membrane protein